MFEQLDMAPPDAILGLTEAFRADPNPDKINLSVGIYKDASGATPVLKCVKQAEQRLLDKQSTKSYLGIEGLAEYDRLVRTLLFGEEHEILANGRAVTVQSPGGTGALRIAGDLLHKKFPTATVWLSQPTWANHPSIFEAAGLRTEIYKYIDADRTGLDFDGMIKSLRDIPAGDVVLLHGCCHNPTGIDPTPQQWREIADAVYERGCLPLLDFAYQGFGNGLREDAAGLLELARPGQEMLVCSSFSKNFGLYSERVGALTIVAGSAEAAEAALSHAKTCVRSNYSNPPQHGAAIVAEVLGDPKLRALWEDELTEMRERINGMRQKFAETMKSKAGDQDFSFITRQRGMFSFSGLSPVQVDELRQKYAVYIVGSGRINVAGMTDSNMQPLCDAIAQVL